MAWAICLTPEDFDEIAAGLAEAGLTGTERNRLRRYTENGLLGWDTAALIPPEHPCYATDAATMRVIVISQGDRTEFLAMAESLVAKYPTRPYLRGYLDLLSRMWVCVDPWPPPVGYFDGMTCT